MQLQEENICHVPQCYTLSLIFSNGTSISYNPSIIYQTTLYASFIVQFDEQLQQSYVSIRIMPTNSAGSNSSDPERFGEQKNDTTDEFISMLTKNSFCWIMQHCFMFKMPFSMETVSPVDL